MTRPTLEEILAALPGPLARYSGPVTPSSLYPHLVHNALLERVKASIIELFDKESTDLTSQ